MSSEGRGSEGEAESEPGEEAGSACVICTQQRSLLVSRVTTATARLIGFCRVWPPAVAASGTEHTASSPTLVSAISASYLPYRSALSARRLYAPAFASW